MGKNFSCNNTGKRKKSDMYETPYSLTRLLLNRCGHEINRLVPILEPACGNGAIVKVLKEYGFNLIVDYDIDKNFFTENNKYQYLITNPPFSLAKQFILKAKEIVTKKFFLLLPLSYLHGKNRYDTVYSDQNFGLKNVYVFTRYPLLGEPLREDGKHKTGMMVYAWYSWEMGYNGKPSIDWLDNNGFVLKTGEL